MDINIERQNDEVFYVQDRVVKIGDEEIRFLKEKVLRNKRKSARLCMHKSVADGVHEMFILHSKESYVRPHEHPNKDVSYHIIEGIADMVLFDEQGGVIDVIPMGEYGTGRKFYCRLNKVRYYMPLVRSDFLLFHETIKGPFKPSDTIYASWAADGDDPDAVARFRRELTSKVDKFVRPAVKEEYREFNKEVLYAGEDLVKASRNDIATLKEKALDNPRRRIRLCFHKDVGDPLHEMLIVHTKGTYVRPHKHLNKSESFHMLEGNADVILLDDRGNVIEVIHLGEYSSGHKFYYRIETSFYHTLIIHSGFLVFHETIKGPFNKADTVFPSWAPEDNDVEARQTYMETLTQQDQVQLTERNFLK